MIYEVSPLPLLLQYTLIRAPVSFWNLDEDEVKPNMFNDVWNEAWNRTIVWFRVAFAFISKAVLQAWVVRQHSWEPAGGKYVGALSFLQLKLTNLFIYVIWTHRIDDKT